MVDKLMIYGFIIFTTGFLTYLHAYQEGWNRGHAIAKCEGIPWADALKCYNDLDGIKVCK